MSLSVYNLLHQTVETTAGEQNSDLVGDKILSIQEWDVVIKGELLKDWDNGVKELNKFLGEALVHPQWVFDNEVLKRLERNTDYGVDAEAVEEIRERQKYAATAKVTTTGLILAMALGADSVFTEREWEKEASQIKKDWDEGGRFGVALFLDKMAEEGWTLTPALRTRIQERLVDKGYLRQELLDAVGAPKKTAEPEKPQPKPEPDQTAPESQDPAFFVQRAREKEDAKQHEEAIKDYAHALDLDPNNTKALFGRGWCRNALGQYEKAIEDYDRYTTLVPDDANGFNNLGYAKRKLDRYAEAVEPYTKALELKPDHTYALFGRGYCRNELGQYEKAIEDYDRYTTLVPDDPDGFNNLGFAKRKLGRYAEAVQDYTKALALKPDYTNALYGLAFCKNELGQREAAIVDLEKLLKITPNDQDTKVLLAEIRAKMAEKK